MVNIDKKNVDKNTYSANGSAKLHTKTMFKIPLFWRLNLELWFRQIESQFITTRVTSDAMKYHRVVAAMESEVLQHVSDIKINPPSTDLYETLKKHLIESFSELEEQRLKKLLNDVKCGEQKPYHFLA